MDTELAQPSSCQQIEAKLAHHQGGEVSLQNSGPSFTETLEPVISQVVEVAPDNPAPLTTACGADCWLQALDSQGILPPMVMAALAHVVGGLELVPMSACSPSSRNNLTLPGQ